MNYRDSVVERLKGADVLKDGNGYNYVLTHTHDRNPRHFYVIAPYTRDTMNALIAFIQQEMCNIEETFGMDQTDVIQVLTKLYDCEVSNERLEDVSEIDLFLNWEMWDYSTKEKNLHINSDLIGQVQMFVLLRYLSVMA